MPYQGKKQQQAPEGNKKARPEEQFVPEQRTFGMPNSLMQAVPITPPSGTPNSVMREMEAEERGALFRGRGFDPSVGAHELSHIVRRESVSRPVSLSVPDGTIQREPPGGPGFLSSDFIVDQLNSLNQIKKSFVGPDAKRAREALQSKMDLETDSQEKARLRNILDQAKDVPQTLFNIEGLLMDSMKGYSNDPELLRQIPVYINGLAEIVSELNAAKSDETNNFAVVGKDGPEYNYPQSRLDTFLGLFRRKNK